MNRVCKSALVSIVLLGFAGGVVSACGAKDDHADHEHKEGDGHTDHPPEKKK